MFFNYLLLLNFEELLRAGSGSEQALSDLLARAAAWLCCTGWACTRQPSFQSFEARGKQSPCLPRNALLACSSIFCLLLAFF